METHEAPQSLWNLIVEHVPESELPEIRGFLGDALIDMYTEMLAEVEVWQHIWREVKQGSPSRAQTPCPTLADPPAVRELLRAQVQLLLLSVRERAARDGRDGDAVMSRYKPAVVNYALATPSNRSDGVGPPSRSSSRSSLSSSGQEEIEAMRSQLNVSSIDQVVAHLQAVLTQEWELLKTHVQTLQSSESSAESSRWTWSVPASSPPVPPPPRTPARPKATDYLQTPRQASATTQPSSRGAAGSPGSCLPPLLPSGYLVTESAPFLPSPPAVQRPPSRGQSVARRLCVPQGDSLVSPT
ncbi:coiled-coil domain-containing protein 24 [Osmerus mordax]|uniref:coiled-coil domain-containing protein 24 n=1 Tax=Osmerus mordax TaxID=8014 RepID=UPI003510CCF7